MLEVFTALLSLLKEYRSVLGVLLHSRPILMVLSLMLITSIYATVNGSF